MMPQAWQSLAPDERRMIAVGGALAVLMLGWAFVWHPLAVRREQLRQDVEIRRAGLAYVQAATANAEAMRATGLRARGERRGRSLLALADETAREAGLGEALERVEPTGERSVRVTMDDADFDVLARWIEGLSRQYGVDVVDLSAERAGGIGRVDARVTLQDAP